MAERYLVSTGDIEVAARWDGGTLPSSGDDLYANGFTGTITASRTALSWRTTAGTTAVAGGGFTCSTAGVSIGGNVIAGTTQVLGITNATGTVTLTGDVTGSTTNNVNVVNKSSGAGSFNHVGNATSGSPAGTNSAVLIQSGAFSGTGNYTGGSGASNSFGIQISSTSSHTIVGNILGGSGSNAIGCIYTAASGSLAITGNCTGGASGVGLSVSGAASTTTVSGDATGGSGASARGVDLSSAGSVTIGGNAIGGTNSAVTATCYGAYNSSSGAITVTGYAIGAPSGGVAAGVFGSIGGTTRVGSVRTSTTGVSGIAGKVFLSNLTTGTLQGANSALTVKTFYPTDYSGLLPAVGDVRNGTTYNLGNSTGTLSSGRPSHPMYQQVIG